MNTNDHSLAQLVEIARSLGVEVRLDQKRNPVRQREQVIGALRRNGVRIQNSKIEKTM